MVLGCPKQFRSKGKVASLTRRMASSKMHRAMKLTAITGFLCKTVEKKGNSNE